ncbi:hypothetical protein [Cryptosporangium sp. NPDC051539]|uniref:hypothetical protein n=1 Tax=Cryptosporangium sp. NPDC051539 TaxID=3363962 RepID=UPI0037A6C072
MTVEPGPASGWVAAAIAIVVAIIAFRSYRIAKRNYEVAVQNYEKAVREANKQIGWRKTSDALVMTRGRSPHLAKLVVMLGDEKLELPRLVTIEFENVGDVELRATDMAKAPTIALIEGAIRAATAEFVYHDGNPHPLTLAEETEKSVAVSPLLLNPGDRVVIRLLIDGTKSEAIPAFQAAGFRFSKQNREAPEPRALVSPPKYPRPSRPTYAWVLVAVGVLLILTVVFLPLLIYSPDKTNRTVSTDRTAVIDCSNPRVVCVQPWKTPPPSPTSARTPTATPSPKST